MARRFLYIFLLIIVLSGCAQFTYYGTIEEQDVNGDERIHLVYWTKTERKLWFDESSGSVKLLTECSMNTVNFDETEDGIVFRCTPNDEGVTRSVNLNEPCGEILDVKKIKELTEGILRLKFYCKYIEDEFTVDNHAYLKAQDGIYDFQIIREKSTVFEDGVPKRPECRN